MARFNSPIGWLQVGEPSVSDPGRGEEVKIAVHPTTGYPLVAYKETGTGMCNVRRWNGSSWLNIGMLSDSFPGSSNINLDFSNAQLGAVVCLRDSVNKASCYRLGPQNTWPPLGSLGFSPGPVDYLSLAVAKGVPYVAFQDNNDPDGKGRVMSFDSKTAKWVNVGGFFSQNTAAYMSLAIHPTTGLPWVFYQEYLSGSLGLVSLEVKNNKRTWKQMLALDPNFGLGSMYNSLAFDSAGTPHIAYQCEGTYKLCVSRVLPTKLVPLGNKAGVSGNAASYINLRFDKLTPYVAYASAERGDRVVVQIFA